MQARERDLGRAREVEVVRGQLVDVRLVGRERARPDERLLPHEDGREHRLEALGREPVEPEAIEGEGEPSRVADPVAEARARHPRSALHVEPPDLEVLARVVELGRLADTPHLADVVLGRAVRDVVVRRVRHAQREGVPLGLGRGQAPPRPP